MFITSKRDNQTSAIGPYRLRSTFPAGPGRDDVGGSSQYPISWNSALEKSGKALTGCAVRDMYESDECPTERSAIMGTQCVTRLT